MPTSHRLLRKIMLSEHKFLYKLFQEKKPRLARSKLKQASSKQIWLVLRLLFCIAVGHIPITRKNYQRLVRSKRKNILSHLKYRMQFFRKRGKTQARREFLYQFSSLFPYLFHDIFVPTKKKVLKT